MLMFRERKNLNRIMYTLFKYYTSTELIKIQTLREHDYDVTVVLF